MGIDALAIVSLGRRKKERKTYRLYLSEDTIIPSVLSKGARQNDTRL